MIFLQQWWTSLANLKVSLGDRIGHLVWYERSATAQDMWTQHKLGELPENSPLTSPCSVRDWLTWHEATERAMGADKKSVVRHLFYLVGVDAGEEELQLLARDIPLVPLALFLRHVATVIEVTYVLFFEIL